MLVGTKEWLDNNMKLIPKNAGCEIVEVTNEELSKTSLLCHPQQVLAVFEKLNTQIDINDIAKKLTLVTDGVQDPGNLGTIIRIADWFGIENIICSTDTVDVYNPKVVQATMGSLARVNITYMDMEKLFAIVPSDLPVYGTLLEGKNIYEQPLTDNGLIIMGNEGKGFYKFNKDFIHFDVDSTGKGGTVDVKLRIIKYRASNNGVETNHKQYFINGIRYASGDGKPFIPLRQKVLVNNTYVEEGQPFSATALQDTYNKFGRLQAVKYTNIHFTELPDTNLLNCDIQISTRKPNSISFQPEGTNTAGDLGAAVSLTYENNNLFRGSELFSIQLRGAFEAISGLDGYQNKDYEEYNVETKLMFPRIIAPFLTKRFKKELNLQSELLFSYNLQNRPEFHRRVLTGAWRYHWKNNRRHRSYRFDLLDINYVHMPWISQTFKTNYLDDVSSRNAILKYNYEDLFILKTGINFHYNNGKHAVRSNFEIGGNLLSAISHILGDKKNAEGQYTLFNIAYAQYVKGDFDYTRVLTIDTKNTLAMHVGLGIAYPYGNSKVLPFEKRYFSGGANSVRGWGVRELGPGRYKGTDGNIDFINQTGDMKLDLNAELRTFLFWKFNGAFFVDAGNIWTLKYYEEQKGGQFRFDEFYKQIAVSYGLGLRLNLDYFVIRLDMGMKAINPVYDNKRQHFPILNPNFSRDMALHFAVGLPF
jgi:tRNA(Leu) C34 or U34 (ribose-2'-O)-methylase TrmL